MANPKYRRSHSKKNMRRSHLALKSYHGAICSNCQTVKHPHRVCEACGFYRGKQVMEPRITDIAALSENAFQAEA